MAGIYVTRPVEVEAMRLTYKNADEVAKWCGGEVTEIKDVEGVSVFVNLNGDGVKVYAFPGNYVVKEDGGFLVYAQYYFEEKFVAKPDGGQMITSKDVGLKRA